MGAFRPYERHSALLKQHRERIAVMFRLLSVHDVMLTLSGRHGFIVVIRCHLLTRLNVITTLSASKQGQTIYSNKIKLTKTYMYHF